MQVFQTPEMKALGLPFSAAVRVGDMLYFGRARQPARTLTLAEGGMAGQARQTMENIGAGAQASAGSASPTWSNARSCSPTWRNGASSTRSMSTYFQPDRLPARSAFGCSGLALGGKLEGRVPRPLSVTPQSSEAQPWSSRNADARATILSMRREPQAQAAERRALEAHPPAIGVENVLNKG